MILPHAYWTKICKILLVILILWLIVIILFYTERISINDSSKSVEGKRKPEAAAQIEKADSNSSYDDEFSDSDPVRHGKKNEVQGPGVLIKARDPAGPGEMGKAVKIVNPD